MDRDELLEREDKAWAGFEDAFAAVSEDRRDTPGVVPGWSVKDLVWHCAYWAGYVGDVLDRIARGEPEPPDQDWEALNVAVNEDGHALSWDQIIVEAAKRRERARTALAALPELTDPAVEEFTGETFEHYEEHAAEIAAFAVIG
jgi:DinB family protein